MIFLIREEIVSFLGRKLVFLFFFFGNKIEEIRRFVNVNLNDFDAVFIYLFFFFESKEI